MKILDFESGSFWKALDKATQSLSQSPEVADVVSSVIANIGKRGDKALLEYTRNFDLARLSTKTLKVSVDELENALKNIPAADRREIKNAIASVNFFHKHTAPKNWRARNPHGAIVGENFYPIERVGLYIPGGQVPLVSSVIMTATIAKLAGCPQICVCTPPNKYGEINNHLLAALALSGVTEIYKAGGAQAIAAMALGTNTIKRVDKIFGPGNAFVIEAKRQLFGKVGIDLLPGPSEVMIIADDKANAEFIAADLLSQAEHGSGKEKIYLACTSKIIVDKIYAELKTQSENLSRAQKLAKIVEQNCYVILVPNLDAATETANFIAPEHLELHVGAKFLKRLSEKITTAGAILMGENTPTVLGDFTAGPSHTLPTERTGRFSSGLQLIDFMRRSSIVQYDKDSVKKASPTVAAFARMESLDAHGNSLKIRER